MENNQDGLKALLQEKDCVGVPANEEYQEYLVDYLLDENLFENETEHAFSSFGGMACPGAGARPCAS